MEYPKFEAIAEEKTPLKKDFISYVLQAFLLEGKTPIEIENEYYLKTTSTGSLAVKVLNSFGLISSNGQFDNQGIYKDQEKDDVIVFLESGNEECIRIANALKEIEIIEPENNVEDDDDENDEPIHYTVEDFKREVFIPDEKYNTYGSTRSRKDFYSKKTSLFFNWIY